MPELTSVKTKAMNHNWEYKSFYQVINAITPASKIEKSEYLDCGLFPIISQEESYISGYWNNREDITPYTSPVVIFGDHSRVLKYIDFEFVVGADGVKILQPINELKAKFLYHYLRWYNIPSLGYSRHFKLIKDARYPLPPIEVQEKIVAELDQINDLIEKNRELLRNLDALAQSLFYDTFGDPITNTKGWEVRSMRDIAPQFQFDGELPYDEEIWLLNLDMIEKNSGRIISHQRVKQNELGSSVYKICPNQVLYSKLRPNLNKVVIADEYGYCTSELIPLNPIKRLINSQYLAYLLRTKECVSYFSGKVAGAKMPRTDLNSFKKFKVQVPPLELQEDFAKKIKAIETQKANIEAEIANLQTLLDSRMDYWFN